MPYATYRFNKIIAAETIRFIVTVAIVVYKGLKLVVYRMLTENKYFIAYFTLILHKTKPSACLGKNQDPCRRFCISEPENQSL
jgi:hypothetical protein